MLAGNLLLILATSLEAAAVVSPAAPQVSDVAILSSLICRAQPAIKRKAAPAWNPALCDRVAGALAKTREPLTVLAICVNESDLRPSAVAHIGPGVLDTGLMGVRCRLRDGRCANGPAAGLTVRELLDPAINIRVGVQVLETKRARHGRHYLRHYNGGTREHGYAGRIAVLVAALGGIKVRAPGRRVEKLARQIIEAVKR